MTQDEREGFFADEPVEFGAHSDRDGSEQRFATGGLVSEPGEVEIHPGCDYVIPAHIVRLAAVERERGELRAEVVMERLRADAQRKRAEKAEAIVARVEALRDEWERERRACEKRGNGGGPTAVARKSRIMRRVYERVLRDLRAAIEGGDDE